VAIVNQFPLEKHLKIALDFANIKKHLVLGFRPKYMPAVSDFAVA
jgi:hypothetical protein